MHLTEIRINLCGGPTFGDHRVLTRPGRLRAFCSLTFDNTFVVRDVKLIEGHEGLFLAMPSRKLCDHCPRCSDKNHLRARFCNNCGSRLDETRSVRQNPGARGAGRVKLHADIAHPISAGMRSRVEQEVLDAYEREMDRSREPGYIAPNLDSEDVEFYDDPAGHADAMSSLRLRPTGTAVH